jgi:hypothetical protein
MRPTSNHQQTFRVILLALPVLLLASAGFAEGLDAGEAFEQLKTMAGTWHGTATGEGATGEGAPAEAEAKAAGEVLHRFEVSAANTVVMETMNPGTPHEMINMYHLDGEDLVLTHYCAAGNQPRMRLDRENSTAKKYIFDFDGGTNLDPAVDQHIHSAAIEWEDSGGLVSGWTSHSGGKEMATMSFRLTRAE